MFTDVGKFPFIPVLESHFQGIKDEALKLNKDEFMSWPEKFLYEGGWKVFGIYSGGKKMERNAALAPYTTKAVEAIPGLTIAGFSWLEPGAHITPHVGKEVTLRCHLGLVVPPTCKFRVEKETREWQEGKCLIFDNTLEHEVWNNSDRVRIVLLLDFNQYAARQ